MRAVSPRSGAKRERAIMLLLPHLSYPIERRKCARSARSVGNEPLVTQHRAYFLHGGVGRGQDEPGRRQILWRQRLAHRAHLLQQSVQRSTELVLVAGLDRR